MPPKTLAIPVCLAALVTLAPVAGAAPAPAPKKVPMVSLSVQSRVAAPPGAVWAQITQGKNLVTWCPVWKSAANQKVNLSRVGDALDFTDAYGNGGRSVVTFYSKDRELRVAHEPNDGSYVCRARLTLEAEGGGTRVTFGEMYSDESKPADMAATAAKTRREMTESLEALARNLGSH